MERDTADYLWVILVHSIYMVRILFKFITDSLVVVWHHVSAEVRVHTGRSVSVNMTVVLFLEISLTDRLNRSYSAVKETNDRCNRLNKQANRTPWKVTIHFSSTYGHYRSGELLRCWETWCRWPRSWVWTSCPSGAWFPRSGWRTAQPRDGATRRSCSPQTSHETGRGPQSPQIPLKETLGNGDLKEARKTNK